MTERAGRLTRERSALRLNAGRYCLIVLATFAIGCAVWVGVAFSHFGRHTNASYGLCRLVEAKRTIARRADEPKVLFVAGSSAIRGLDAARVHRATGINLVNFGLHAGLPPGVMLHEAKKVLEPGDAAILGFEYTAYTRTGPTSRGIDFVYGCGESYFDQAPWDARLMILFGLSPLQVVKPFVQSPRAYFAKWGRDETAFGPRGDLPPAAFDRPDPRRVQAYGPEPIGIAEGGTGAREVAAFIDWAAEQGVDVFATWPNTIEFPTYEDHPGFEEVRDFYDELDVPVIGQPQDAMFPKSLHYNTNYHLKVEGVRLRTERFIDLLGEVDVARSKTPSARHSALVEKPGNHPVEPVRQRDLRLPIQ